MRRVRAPGAAWLWLAPLAAMADGQGGYCLALEPGDWGLAQRFATPFSIPAESLGTVVLQHVADGAWDPAPAGRMPAAAESGRRLWLFSLNRWRRIAGTGAAPASAAPNWWSGGDACAAPASPGKAVSPGHRPALEPAGGRVPATGAGIRAAYLLRAEKTRARHDPGAHSPAIAAYGPGDGMKHVEVHTDGACLGNPAPAVGRRCCVMARNEREIAGAEADNSPTTGWS